MSNVNAWAAEKGLKEMSAGFFKGHITESDRGEVQQNLEAMGLDCLDRDKFSETWQTEDEEQVVVLFVENV